MGHRLGTSLDAGRGRDVEGVHRIAMSGEVGRRGDSVRFSRLEEWRIIRIGFRRGYGKGSSLLERLSIIIAALAEGEAANRT